MAAAVAASRPPAASSCCRRAALDSESGADDDTSPSSSPLSMANTPSRRVAATPTAPAAAAAAAAAAADATAAALARASSVSRASRSAASAATRERTSSAAAARSASAAAATAASRSAASVATRARTAAAARASRSALAAAAAAAASASAAARAAVARAAATDAALTTCTAPVGPRPRGGEGRQEPPVARVVERQRLGAEGARRGPAAPARAASGHRLAADEEDANVARGHPPGGAPLVRRHRHDRHLDAGGGHADAAAAARADSVGGGEGAPARRLDGAPRGQDGRAEERRGERRRRLLPATPVAGRAVDADEAEARHGRARVDEARRHGQRGGEPNDLFRPHERAEVVERRPVVGRHRRRGRRDDDVAARVEDGHQHQQRLHAVHRVQQRRRLR
ncbi:hypothetical protein BU14_1160s0006 [Porphyra umbilicalis]|uniref:Uncharacterized protein n=1 Tax=Porphyra umbilicalis TaxID=2786 RepID=A0A1X6NMD0_PORUM|nr:hypothetical protein BU14_1160s0006 [Porphyra umbilicalis]|eukprot:OSX69784.1 hypothetical protein BU14_1160s0006 [Porphyra umbilicalis]